MVNGSLMVDLRGVVGDARFTAIDVEESNARPRTGICSRTREATYAARRDRTLRPLTLIETATTTTFTNAQVGATTNHPWQLAIWAPGPF